MKDNAKCFIKIKKCIYEGIQYKDLKEKRKRFITYKNKEFIKIEDSLLEVSKKEYEIIESEDQRRKYVKRIEKRKVISYDNKDENGTVFINSIKDVNYDIENEVERKMEIERLKKALLKLNDNEYKLIKEIFYKEISLREYARINGIPFTTVQSRKDKIIKKLKNILKN